MKLLTVLVGVASASVWESGTVIETGCLIGNLRIIEKIGRGRNAFVFKAQALDSEQLFAVKASESTQQLEREAEALQALSSSEGFPEFYCSGPGFIVMQLMEGFKSLDKMKADNDELPLPIEDIAIQLIERLESVHRAGFLHVDVHKRNIMVSQSDGRVVLLDFGLALPISGHKNSDFVNLFLSSIYEQVRQPLHPIDDIERLMYVLLHYSFGPLPWASFVGMHEAMEAELEPTKDVTAGLQMLEQRIFELKFELVWNKEYFTSNHVAQPFIKILEYVDLMRPLRESVSFTVDYETLRAMLREGQEPVLPVRLLKEDKTEASLEPSLLPIDSELK
jgi:serine/threonine protein kinase